MVCLNEPGVSTYSRGTDYGGKHSCDASIRRYGDVVCVIFAKRGSAPLLIPIVQLQKKKEKRSATVGRKGIARVCITRVGVGSVDGLISRSGFCDEP